MANIKKRKNSVVEKSARTTTRQIVRDIFGNCQAREMLRCFSVSSYRSLQEEDSVSDIVALQDDAVPQERHRVSLDDTVPAPRTFRKPASPLGPPARRPPPPAGKGSPGTPRPLSSPPSAVPAALGDRLSPASLLLPASSSSPSPGRRRASPGGLDGSRAPPGFVKHLEANLRRKDPAGGTADAQQGAAERYIRLPTQGTQSNNSNNNNVVNNNNLGPTSPPEVPAPPVPQALPSTPVPLPRAKTPDASGGTGTSTTASTTATAPIPAARNLPVGRSPVVGRKMATAAARQQGLVSRPPGGWLHPDREIMGQGVTYGVRYIGCLEVKTSMKCLDFDTRSLIAKECISRVCEAAGLKTVDKKRKVDRRLQRMLADRPSMDHAGSNVNLRVTSSSLNLTVMESGEVIACHEMPNISFASGGDAETLDFVAYVAKDSHYSRACFVLECGGGLAQDVITTIGQAFKLRFREFMRWAPSSQPPLPGLPDRQDSNVSATSNGVPGSRAVPREDPEYYNDLPGKIPPEAPPPVPPLPDYRVDDVGATEALHCTAAKETTGAQRPPTLRQTVPPQPTARKLSRDTNLIDLSGDVPVPAPSKFVHDYVNTDPILKASENGVATEPAKSSSLDPFDMQPFANSVPPPPPRHHPRTQATTAPPVAPPRPISAAPTVVEPIVEPNASASDRQRALEKEEWFHGAISRQESETRVTGDGDFLVRESRGSPGQYVLTGMQGTARRHLLLVDPQGVVRTKDRTFESVSHLINYHRDNGLPIISAESALVLKTAVPRLPR